MVKSSCVNIEMLLLIIPVGEFKCPVGIQQQFHQLSFFETTYFPTAPLREWKISKKFQQIYYRKMVQKHSLHQGEAVQTMYSLTNVKVVEDDVLVIGAGDDH